MQDMYSTTKLTPIQESSNEARDILMYVYQALQAKGYDPITQLVGYIISGDPTYITSYNQARSLICRLERDEILEEIVRFYVNGSLEGHFA
ncbi:MAG: IreB family regulatory phosphoprotein [Clostridia bacterium]|nr:IreB family regulatory phosphoprotein [Clostridia bacterium]